MHKILIKKKKINEKNIEKIYIQKISNPDLLIRTGNTKD